MLQKKNLKVGVYGDYASLKNSVDPQFGKTDYLHQKTVILPNRSWRHALIRALSEPGASSMKLESSKKVVKSM